MLKEFSPSAEALKRLQPTADAPAQPAPEERARADVAARTELPKLAAPDGFVLFTGDVIVTLGEPSGRSSVRIRLAPDLRSAIENVIARHAASTALKPFRCVTIAQAENMAEAEKGLTPEEVVAVQRARLAVATLLEQPRKNRTDPALEEAPGGGEDEQD
jgi:hypothetical protein